MAYEDPTALDRGTLVVAGVALLGAFVTLIDTTAVLVSLDSLSGEFGVPLATIQWVATAYTLALAATFPVTGWAADRFGVRRVYVAGLAVFIAGSVLCALSSSAGSLIAFRIVQGVGGGLILPAGMTIVTAKAGPHRRGRVMGILGVPLVTAPILGPILGGWLVDAVSWHWIFLANLPVGGLAIGLSLAVLDRGEPQPGQRLDWLGMGLLSPGLTLALFGLAESAERGLGTVRCLLPLLLGAGLVAAFLVHAWRAEAPLIDVRQFAHRRAGAAAAVLMLATIAVFGTLLLIPLYCQTVRGASALEAGLLMAPWGVGVMAMLPVAGWLTDRVGPRRLPCVGLALMVVGFVPLALITAETSTLLLGAAAAVIGLGDALVFVPATAAVLTAAPRRALARVSTAVSIIDESGASIGTAAVSVLVAGSLGGATAARPAVFAAAFAWMAAALVLALGPALLLAGARQPATVT